MFKKPTVLIIGAGASHECGLPLGSALKDQVGAALRFQFDQRITSGDPQLYDLLQQRFGNNVSTQARAANQLASVVSTFVSIDEALHYFSTRPEIIELGKVAIVREILRAEGNSLLKYERNLGRPDVARVNGKWFSQFLSMALSGVKRDEIDQAFAAITVVNFNYDRSLEHYLYWALQTQAAVSQEQAARLVSSLRIVRPYGCVGALDWQEREGVRFGSGDPLGLRLFSLAAGIRTYTEQHQSDLPNKITEALSRAEVIIFLGFGYHAQNTELFQRTPAREGPWRQVYATAKGIDRENFNLITSQLQSWLRGHVKLLDKTSASLLSDLRPSILNAAS